MCKHLITWTSILLWVACSGRDAADPGQGTDAVPPALLADTESEPNQTTGGTDLPEGTDFPSSPSPACALDSARIRITSIDVGQPVIANEEEATLSLLAISPIPSGGARLAWMGTDGMVHVTTLDAADRIVANSVAIPAHDYADLYATEEGGVLLLTRAAQGGGVGNCGSPANLCRAPSDPIPCYDMYLVGFDGAGETWATKLTESSADLPPYSTGPDGPDVTFIWWYAHHGRIASNGRTFAAYYGAAISVSQEGCINIHQGDRMDVIDATGRRADGGFAWGCSHSGYERVVWDPVRNDYTAVCVNDAPTDTESGRIAFAPQRRTIFPQDLSYNNTSDIVLADGGGYWMAVSKRQEGQPPNADGIADVFLVHFHAPEDSDLGLQQLLLTGDVDDNARAPHIARYGTNGLLVAFETSTAPGQLGPRTPDRTLWLQVRDAATGAPIGNRIQVSGVAGNRYQSFRSFPDGSVAYPSKGETERQIKILRILPCEEER